VCVLVVALSFSQQVRVTSLLYRCMGLASPGALAIPDKRMPLLSHKLPLLLLMHLLTAGSAGGCFLHQ